MTLSAIGGQRYQRCFMCVGHNWACVRCKDVEKNGFGDPGIGRWVLERVGVVEVEGV